MIAQQSVIKLLCKKEDGIVDVLDTSRVGDLDSLLWDQAIEEDILFWHGADDGEEYTAVIEGEYVRPKKTRYEPGHDYLEITGYEYHKGNLL